MFSSLNSLGASVCARNMMTLDNWKVVKEIHEGGHWEKYNLPDKFLKPANYYYYYYFIILLGMALYYDYKSKDIFFPFFLTALKF